MKTRAFLAHLLVAIAMVTGAAALVSAQGVLTNGISHPGAIGTAGEVDVWSFDADQGDALYVRVGEVLASGVPDPGYYPWVRLRGPNNTILGTNWDNVDAGLAVAAPLTGTYTVEVASYYTATGAYRVTLAKAPGAYQVGSGDQGGALTNGLSSLGRVEVGDLDLWTVSAAQGDQIYVRIGERPVGSGQPDPGFYPWLRIVGPNGAILGTNWDNVDASLAIQAPLTGDYTVIAASYYGTAGDYQLTLAKAPGTFQVATGDQGGPLTNGITSAGALTVGDIDMWSFNANQGDALYVRIGEVLVGQGQPDPGFYPWIRLIGPTGTILGTNWDNLDAGIAAAAPLTGAYTVLVAAYYGTPGAYRLTLAQAPGAFQTASGDDGGPLANGPAVTGRIELGDIDLWSFSANQGDAIWARVGEILVPPTQPDPGFYPWLRLISPTGAILSTNWANVDAGVAATAPVSGVYTLLVASYYGATGDYRLTLANAPGAYSVGAGDQGGPLSNNTAYTARITLGDIDLWSFNACQGQSVTVTMTEIPVSPTQPDPGFYPYFNIIGPTGNQSAVDWDNLVASVTFNPTVTGLYTVRSASYYDTTGDYTIRVLGACAAPSVPTTVDDSQYSTPFNTQLVVAAPGVLANDLNAATASLSTGVTSGTLSLNANGSFTYTPAAGFSGAATFTYRAVNAAGPGNVATVTITVQPPGAPTAANDSFTAIAGTPLTVAAPGVLGNDTSPGGSALSAVLTSSTTNGSLGLNANGSFTYTPNASFSGTDTFSYRATNANGSSNVATVTIAVGAAVTGVQPPTNFRARSIIGNTITLAWSAPAAGPAPTGYLLEGGVTPGQVLAAFPTGSATPTFTLNAPNGAFYLRLKSLEGGQTSAASNEIRVYVNQPVAPSAPSHLTGLTNGSQVGLSWRNTFAGGTPSGITLDVSGTLSGSLPLGPVETFTFPSMPAGTYTFSVRASNAFGASASSNAVTLTFPNGCTGAPQVPENFLAYAAGNVLNLAWDPAGSGAATTSYVLNVSGPVNVSVPWVTRGLSVPVGPGSYTFSIAAVNSCGTSAATAAQTVVVP